jgi:hypothetical protein
LTSAAVSASIGCTGVNGRMTTRSSAAAPSTSAVRATVASDPSSIALRRRVAAGMFVRTSHALEQHSFERALSQLAKEQTRQEILLIMRSP